MFQRVEWDSTSYSWPKMDQISYFSLFIPCTLLETGAEKYLVIKEEEKGEV